MYIKDYFYVSNKKGIILFVISMASVTWLNEKEEVILTDLDQEVKSGLDEVMGLFEVHPDRLVIKTSVGTNSEVIDELPSTEKSVETVPWPPLETNTTSVDPNYNGQLTAYDTVGSSKPFAVFDHDFYTRWISAPNAFKADGTLDTTVTQTTVRIPLPGGQENFMTGQMVAIKHVDTLYWKDVVSFTLTTPPHHWFGHFFLIGVTSTNLQAPNCTGEVLFEYDHTTTAAVDRQMGGSKTFHLSQPIGSTPYQYMMLLISSLQTNNMGTVTPSSTIASINRLVFHKKIMPVV